MTGPIDNQNGYISCWSVSCFLTSYVYMQSKIRIFEGHSPAFFIIAAFKSTIVHYYTGQYFC